MSTLEPENPESSQLSTGISASAAPPSGASGHKSWFRLRSAGRSRHWIKRTWLRRLTLVLTSLVVVGATLSLTEYAYFQHEFNKAHKINVQHLVPPVTTGLHANAQTILLIGSTSRCALNGKQSQAFGSCSGPATATTGITGVNSDVMLLLHTDPATGKVTVLSLPRDLVLYNVRDYNFHKLDAGLSSGPSQLVAAIEQDLGIPINHFVELNFDTFQNVVNTLGGVKVYFPDRVYDKLSGLNEQPGCQLLNGFQALSLVRARHMYYWQSGAQLYDGTGDLGRIIRTHEFLRLLASQVAAQGLGNIITDNQIIGEVFPNLTIDSTLTSSNMSNLILNYHGVNIDKTPQATLPNIEDHTNYIYEGYNYGSVVLPSYPQDQQAINQFLDYKSNPAADAVKPSSVSVRVVDGYNDPAVAASTATKLKALGYNVAGSGTWPSVGPVSETVIEYKPGHLVDAESLISHFSGIVSMTQAPTTSVAGSDVPAANGYDVTVITGSNFSITAAQQSGSGGSHHSSGHHGSGTPGSGTSGTTPVSGAPSSSVSLLGPVSAASDPKLAYDPRACHT